VSPLYRLRVAPGQEGFVAPNEFSLAQAPYETGATPYVIWSGDARVGFLQVIDMREYAYRDPADDPNALYLWRFMIGAEFQGKGFGTAALSALIGMARKMGVSAVEVSVVAENAVALRFYEGLGMTRTGRLIDGEIQLRLGL
jgi:diamine N-acetyltransferase